MREPRDEEGAFGRSTWTAVGLGVLYMGALGALEARRPLVAPDERVLGSAARAVAELVRTRYADEIAHIVTSLVAATVAVGAGLGLLARLQLALRSRLAESPPRACWREALIALAVIVFDHAAFVAWSMARTPALYASRFYAAGGLLAATEVVVTDRLGPRGVVAIATAATALLVLGAPTAWPRALARAARAVPRRAATVLLGVALAVLVWSAATGRAATPAAGPHRPNVLILASDSLRADRIRPDVAPHLFDLAEHGTSFSRAYVTVPRTLSSWMTILTGRHAHHHGVRSTFARWEDRLGPFDTLPERFERAGYRTGVVSDFAGDIFSTVDIGFRDALVPRTGFRQLLQQRGIERDLPILPFIDTSPGRLAFPAAGGLTDGADPRLVADAAIAEIRRFAAEPFLLTVFFSTTHFPYAAPAPYHRRFADPAYDGPSKYARGMGLAPETTTPPAEIRQVRALYDGAVASVDDSVARILRELQRDGIDDRTVIVLTSDHGENLFERENDIGHGDHLFGDEGTHVPLVIVDPRAPGPRRDATVVSSVDIAPTLYELAGIQPRSDLDGRSLASALRGASLTAAPVFAETELWLVDQPAVPATLRIPYPHVADLLEVDAQHGDAIVLRRDADDVTLMARHRMVRDERWKLLYIPTRTGVRYMLFDTSADPAEVHDVFAQQPAESARLEALLWTWMLGDRNMTKVRGYLVPKDRASRAGVTPTEHEATSLVHLRFGGGQKGHHVGGVIFGASAEQVRGVHLLDGAVRVRDGGVSLDLDVQRGSVVGVDLQGVTLPLRWELTRDGQAWPEDRVFAGPFGLRAGDVRDGLASCGEGSRGRVPYVDGSQEAGLFVSCEGP